MLRAAVGPFLLLVAIGLAPACGRDQPPCTPESEGFADAAPLTRTIVLEVDRTQGTCRPRVEVYRAPEDLKRLYDELELGDPPAVDFTKEVVVVREGTGERGIRWLVLRADVVTVGTQGCNGDPPSRCLVEIFRIENRAAIRGNEQACAAITCTAVSSDPGGGD